MKGKLKFIIGSFVVVCGLYMLLLFNIPEQLQYNNVKSVKTNNLVKLEDFNIYGLKYYKINNDLLDKFKTNNIVKYGKANPMSFQTKNNSNNTTNTNNVAPNNSLDNIVNNYNTVDNNTSNIIDKMIFSLTNYGVLPVDKGIFNVVSGFGKKVKINNNEIINYGLDICKNDDKGVSIMKDKPVYAILNGKVEFVGQSSDFGNVIIIDHQNGFETMYAGLNNISKEISTGNQVSTGQVLANISNIGKSNDCHLYFQLKINGKPVDPLPFLNPIINKK